MNVHRQTLIYICLSVEEMRNKNRIKNRYINAHKYLTWSVKSVCVTCKPDLKDEPCIAFYSLSCIAINNRHREKVPDDKSGDMYISHVRSEHCDWSTENMRQLDLCHFNLSVPI